MASEAYNNPKHADHARVSKRVQQHFERQAAEGERKYERAGTLKHTPAAIGRPFL
jgi:hypothetical protein